MHDQAIRLQQFRALFGQAEKADVFAEAGEIFLALTLVLDAQEIYHIGCRQDLVDVDAKRSTPSFSNSRGTSVLGPTSVTCAPSLSSPKMFERATRLKRMSPIITTCSPAIAPFFSRIV